LYGKDIRNFMKKLKLLVLLTMSAFCVTGCDLPDFLRIDEIFGKKEENKDDSGSQDGGGGSGDHSGGDDDGGGSGGGSGGGGDETGYYAEIDSSKEGTELLTQLRALNSEKKTKNVGYSNMGTSPAGAFKYTDYDPSTVQYDENNQPYGTKISVFYTEDSMTSFNREHVWPNTHGGNLVEHDIHMTRPADPDDNGARGHSFYMEGTHKKNEGWDPGSLGDVTYRGDSARIIFYCMVASSQLTLTDDGSRSSLTSNREMGVISEMLKWNVQYTVSDRENRRNDGAEYLQGNRNPFIDHPEYACKIWGSYNKQVCGGN